MNKKDLKIAVIGAGAIGGVMGTLLAHNGYDVEISKRLDEEFVVIDNSVCMEITGKFGDVSCLVPYVKDNEFTSKKDIIFLCVSAYNLEWCIEKALRQLKPKGVIVALQNVLSLDDLKTKVPKNKLYFLYNDWNSVRLSGKDIFVYDAGGMHLGALTNNLDMPISTIKQVLACITDVQVERDFVTFLMSRFILDNTLLCMGAISGLSVGGFLSIKQGKNIFIHLLTEQVNVVKKANIKVMPFDGNFDYNLFVEQSISAIFYRSRMFRRLIMQNGNVVSRVLRRFENNKKTEVDYLMKKMCEWGDRLGVDTPYADATNALLQQIANKERTICTENMYDELYTKI